MVFVVQSGNATIINLPRFWYQRVLNGIRQFEIVTDGVASTLRAELAVGKVVKIYREGTLEFQGKIKVAEKFQGGGVIVTGLGQEKDMVDTKCPVDSGKETKTWTSTNDDDIFTALIGEVSGWTADVSGSTAASLDSFRVSKSMSVWNGIKSLLKHTNKDIEIIDSSKTIKFLDAKGSSDVYTFNEGINCGDIAFREEELTATKVIVYGKGDGENQIIGSSGSGVPVLEIVDRNIITTTEANNRAAKELAVIQNNLKHYNFISIKPNLDLEVGDSVILNADSVGLHNASIDIVKITRGVNNNSEELSLEVTNPELRIASRNAEEERSNSEMRSITGNSAMQGSGNLSQWGAGINANNSVSLKVNFEVSAAYFQDEAGNLRVSTMTLDYDVDKYNSQYGGATFSGSDPQVQNSSGSASPDVENNSGYTHPDVENNSGYAEPSVTGDSGASWAGNNIGTSSSVGSCPSGVWTTVASVDTTNTDKGLYASFYVAGVSGGPEDIQIKVENTGVLSANDAQYGSYHDGFRDDSFHEIHGIAAGPNDLNDAVRLRVFPFTGAIVIDAYLSIYERDHTHDDGSYAAVNHPHDDGTYAAVSHPHADGTYAAVSHPHADGTYDINAADIDHISIGDGVGEAGNVNASGIDIHLDFWNTGTESWDLDKHTIIGTGKTLDRNVDITNSGTYPDAVGYWRVRILTNHATPDFVQSILNIKHQIDA